MMWKIWTFFADITPSWLPGYKPGGDNSSTALTQGRVQGVLQIVFAIFGAVAVIVITIAGIQYILSQGEPQKTAKAKNTIIYAIVGLVVSLSAYIMVAYIINQVA